MKHGKIIFYTLFALGSVFVLFIMLLGLNALPPGGIIECFPQIFYR